MQYYKITAKGMLPLRWMAPESVLQGLFTLPSDIWMCTMLIADVS